MTTLLEREWIAERKPTWPPDVMPPMNVIKCQCDDSCPLSDPCEFDATDEDLLCELCREAKKHKEQIKSGVFNAGMVSAVQFMRKARTSLRHCHQCDPEFANEGEDDSGS